MKLEGLFESPQYTFPQDFELEDFEFNKKQGAKILYGRKTPIEAIGDYTLYELPRGYALLHNDTAYIAYLMKFNLDFFKFLQRQCASQVLVWRKVSIPESKDLAANIFFNHLLPKYQTIITDTSQTPDGERFWEARIAEAITKNFYVYYVNLLPNREVTRIHSWQELDKFKKDKEIWGDAAKHQPRRIIITTKEMS